MGIQRLKTPLNIRRPEDRAALTREADQILSNDRSRARRMLANNALRGAAKPPVKKRKFVETDSPFGKLVHHPLYQARNSQ